MAAQVGGPVLSVRHFEAQPPNNLELQVDSGDVVATTKEEEWVTKKKTELTTTRQIETRVKRQVVLEDGHVVEDSGPVVTTNTTEDTQKQEQESKEHRTLDGDPPGEDWVVVPGPGGALVKEVTERTVKTREEVQDRVETEDVQHLGDISDEAYQGCVTRGEDLRQAVGRELVANTGPRVVHTSRKARRTQDTADCTALSELQPDGRVITETRRTTEHEEERDDEEPDSDELSRSDHQETRKESSHRFAKTKDQDLVEYLADGVKIGEEMRYTAENMEGEREGDATDMPSAHQAWDTLSSRIRRMRRQANKAAAGGGATPAVPLDRKDALTRKPLDFDQEEETRKVETSKWLEHHFGSESRSSKDSIEDEDLPSAGRNTSFINVTMKSRPITNRLTSPVNGATARPGATSSTQVNGNAFFPMPLNGTSHHSKTVTSSANARISSPVNGSSVSPSFIVNTRSSGFSSPVNGVSRNGNGVSSINGFKKSSGVSSPVNGSSTPKSFVATVNSSSRVFVSSPESERPPSSGANGYFQGVSDWSERHNDVQVQETRQTFSPPPSSLLHHPDRVQVLPTGPAHTFALKTHPYTNNASDSKGGVHYANSRTSPYPSGHFQQAEHRLEHQIERASPFQSLNHLGSRHNLNQSPYSSESRQEPNQSSRYEYLPSSHAAGIRPEQRTSPHPLRDSPSHKQSNGWAEHEEDGYRGYRNATPHEEPDPDYSPPAVPRKDSPEGVSPHSSVNKKLYQRTRFAADIPPPQTQTRAVSRSKSPGSFIGDSFRKLVGKFRSSSSERKSKRAAAKASKNSPSRSPSPPRLGSPSYQQFHVIDNNIPSAEGGRVGRGGDAEEGEQPVAPPRLSRSNSQKQQDAMDRPGGPTMQKYYLGEDPFGGSIYGREKEYDGVTPVKRRSHHRQNGHRRGSHEEDDMNRANVSQVVTSTSTLGRVSKSSSRLVSSSPVDYTRTSQTLPRKLHHEERHSSSMLTSSPVGINVSIVNNVTPAKPARTYRSNLSRSQSFNVQPAGAPRSGVYTSNPALNRLGESHAPLKSPAILASISRSQRDLTATTLDEDGSPRFSRSTSNLIADPKKQMFMEGLADRAPELFKTLHGEEVRQMSTSPPGMIFTSTPLRSTRIVETSHTSTTVPVRNGYSSSPLRNGLIMDSMHSNGSASPVRNGRLLETTSYSNTSSSNRNSRSNGVTPMRNGRIESSNSFRSSSTNDSDPVKHLSSPYRPVVNGDRVTSPSLYSTTAVMKSDRVQSPGFTSSLCHSPVDGTTTSRSVVRRGSGDDYSETVHIKSKNDDPVRPSETNTIQSFSKKVVPLRGGSGRATEVVESSERTTVTKSSFRGGGLEPLGASTGYTSRNGGVVIEVRPGRK